MDRINGSTTTNLQLLPGRDYESEIDFESDEDWFYTYLVPGIRYELTLRAQQPDPLSSPHLRILEADRTVLFTGTPNENGNVSRIQFSAPHRERLFLSAQDRGTGTGNYKIALRALDDDYANNVQGAGELVFEDGMAKVSGIIEQFADQDWFKVRLKANTWYEIKSGGIVQPAFFVRNGSRKKLTALDTHDRFYSERAGDYYVVVRRNRWKSRVGEYELTVKEGEVPFLSTHTGQTTSAIQISPRVDTNEFPIKHFHIYSDDRLGFGFTQYAYSEKEPGRIYRASLSNLWRWKTLSNQKKNSNLYVRGLTSLTDDGFKTPWLKFNVASVDATHLLSGSRWRPSPREQREIMFSFAEGLPDYFDGDNRFNDFAPLTPSQRESVREAIRRWDVVESSLKFVEVEPNAENNNAEFMIFSADIDAPVTGFRPAAFGGSDLVLDRNSNVLNDLRLGSRGFFELIRGVGKTLGLKADNRFSRNESALGRYVDGETFNAAYPVSPGPVDIEALTDTYDRFRYRKADGIRTGDTTYQFTEGVADSILDFGGIDTIDGSGDTRVVIDLTPGNSSYQYTSDKKSVLTITYDAAIENAIGSLANDRLLGNGWNNDLTGGNGKDFLQGRVGNDRLFGGKANDEYYYELGDGNDIIKDEGGVHDHLVIHGMFSFNDITDDLTFQKINRGRDLKITLALDSDNENRQGSIVIRNMHQRKYQVETLSISNPQRDFGDVSLRNLFQQATSEAKRFTFTQGNDEFGRFVAPA